MVASGILFFLGVWIYRRSARRTTRLHRQAYEDLFSAKDREEQAFEKLLAEKEKTITLLNVLVAEQDKAITLLKESNLPELDRQVMQDAMMRELRAKAAVIGVLKQQGCDQSQIDEVINAIDDVQAGDL